MAGSCQPPEPTANGSQRPRGGCLRKTSIVKRAQVSADLRVLDTIHSLLAAKALGDEGGKAVQFTLIGAQGVRGSSTLIGQHPQIIGDKSIERRHDRGLAHAVCPLGIARGRRCRPRRASEDDPWPASANASV